jgi:hypothetical protein
LESGDSKKLVRVLSGFLGYDLAQASAGEEVKAEILSVLLG